MAAPFKGLSPGLHRQFIFTGLRLGLYDHIKRWVAGDVGDASLGHKVVAAVITSSGEGLRRAEGVRCCLLTGCRL